MTQSPRLCMVYQRLDTWIFRPKSHDTRCYFNVHSKADVSQLSLPHRTNKKVGKKIKSNNGHAQKYW